MDLLVAVDAPFLPNVQSFLNDRVACYDLPHPTWSLVTSSGRLGPGKLPGSAYNSILSISQHHNVAALGVLAAALKPGGQLLVEAPCTTPATAAALEAELAKSLTLSGFINLGSATFDAQRQSLMLRAQKPQWETGVKAAIKLRPKAPLGTQKQQVAAAASKWTLSAADDDEVDLIDDDALLTEEDLVKPTVAGKCCTAAHPGNRVHS
jgi:hypothetical protein